MIIENTWIIAPISLLDVPMRTAKFEQHDEDGNVTGYDTVREYCNKTSAQWRESSDGRYMLFGHELSDLDNDVGAAKSFAIEHGLTLAGSDFTQTSDNLVWILNYSETKKFLNENKMFSNAVDK